MYMNIAAITFMALALLARGLSPAQTGVVLGVLPVVQVITQPVWGVLADTSGQTKRLLTLACAGLVAASVGLWAARAFVPLLLAMVAVAVMRAGILPLVTAMARTRPAFACGTAGGIEVLEICVCPATAAPTACAG